MKDLVDRALLVVAAGILILVFDTIAAVSGQVDRDLVMLAFELDLVVVAAASAIAFAAYGDPAERDVSRN